MTVQCYKSESATLNFEFKFTDELNILRESVHDFTNNEIKPIAYKIDQGSKIPDNLSPRMDEFGSLGISFQEEYGGGGFGEVGFCVIPNEIARGCMSTATFIGAHQSIETNAIFIGDTEEKKKNFIPPLTAEEKIAAFGLTETQAGSDPFHLTTHAEPYGNEWVINGEKLWITNGGITDIISMFA